MKSVGIRLGSRFEDHAWFPLDLDDGELRTIDRFIFLLQSGLAESDPSSSGVMDELETSLILPKLSDVLASDHLSVLSHLINGWGDATWGCKSFSDSLIPFLHQNRAGKWSVFQCHPEGEVHPWQSFAYTLFAGMKPWKLLPGWPTSLEEIMRFSNKLGTDEGEQLGHLLFAAAFLELADDDKFELSLFRQRLPLQDAFKLAAKAHFSGHFGVCRKFHLTEGLCAMARRKKFLEYDALAQSFFSSHMDLLVVFCAAHWVNQKKIPKISDIQFFDSICSQIGVGKLFVNHLFYAGHLLELMGVGMMFGYELDETQINAGLLMRELFNKQIAFANSRIDIPENIYQLGHFRRGATMIDEFASSTPRDIDECLSRLSRFVLREKSDRALVSPIEPRADGKRDPYTWHRFVPPKSALSDQLSKIVKEFNSRNSMNLEAIGRHSHFRRVQPRGWPRAIHFEFLEENNGVSVELHFESDRFYGLARDVFLGLSKQKREFHGLRIAIDERWNLGVRIFLIDETDTLSPSETVDAMLVLIGLASPLVSSILPYRF